MKNNILKNISYVFIANSICIVVNVIINFLIPIIFNENAYAYYQLENLYCGYLWILTLGWHEGIYIFYGGLTEDKIDKDGISNQFWMLLCYMTLVLLGIIIFSKFYFDDETRRFVIFISMLSVMIETVRYVYLYYLICINNVKKYSNYLIADRIIYIFCVISIVILNKTGYRELLFSDIFSKLLVVLYMLFFNKGLFFRKISSIKKSLNHTKTLIFSGINVSFAAFVNRFIFGTVRLAIDACWGILVFGKISLTLSISNMFTQFVQALGVVLFPVLRRTTISGQKTTYLILSELLDAFMFLVFIFYLPGVNILRFILPQYKEGLHYMAILFPICLFDARNSILNNTYLKALHKERGLLISNFIAVLCSVLLTFLSVYILHNLDLAILTMLILAIIKSVCAEIILKQALNIEVEKHLIIEIILSCIFVFANWYVSGIYGALVYGIVLLMYYILKFKSIKKAIGSLKSIG